MIGRRASRPSAHDSVSARDEATAFPQNSQDNPHAENSHVAALVRAALQIITLEAGSAGDGRIVWCDLDDAELRAVKRLLRQAIERLEIPMGFDLPRGAVAYTVTDAGRAALEVTP